MNEDGGKVPPVRVEMRNKTIGNLVWGFYLENIIKSDFYFTEKPKHKLNIKLYTFIIEYAK